MFTGIVTDVGRVRAVRDTNRDRRFEIETSFHLADVAIGASINHAGCCLTVVENKRGVFTADVMLQTLAMSSLGALRVGDPVNLERAVTPATRLGGHIVSGHVDGIGEVLSVESEGGSHRVRIRAPRPLHRFIAPKGSITIAGVSLTVNDVADDVFGVNLIPHTWDVTTLGELTAGARVNLEIDMLARYLARWRETA